MDNHGTLVGWTHTDLGSRMLVNLQSVQTVAAARRHEPDTLRVLMTRNQAAVLGSYLLRISGHRPPRPVGWFRRLFG